MPRGRPTGQMTHRRRQVLDAMTQAAIDGERITMAALARRCGLCDYREASRIARDLRRMGRA